MGNIPVFSSSKALEEIDTAVKGNNAINSGLNCIFPFDQILVALLSTIPAACLTVLLFFSSSAFGEASLVCTPTVATINKWSDFDFVRSYCWNDCADYRTNATGQLIYPQTATKLTPAKHYPYILFLWCIVGVSMTFIWKASTAYISKEVEFVRHGVEEASSMLLADLKASIGQRCVDKKVEEMTDFSDMSHVTIEVVKKAQKGQKFKLLEAYLCSRSKRYFFVVRIVFMRLLYIVATTFCAAWLHRDYVSPLTSEDGRDLTSQFNCRLPDEYIWTDQTTHETVRCYFKGRSTRMILSNIMFYIYCLLAFACFVRIFVDFRRWKKYTGLLAYFKFDSSSGTLSDLDVIMAFVYYNSLEATTVLMRIQAVLRDDEKNAFMVHLTEYVHWHITDENIGEITKTVK